MNVTQLLRKVLLVVSLLVFAGAAHSAPVNINTADAATLANNISGVGLKKAQAIVAYRQTHGPFKNAQELANVKGIGMKTVQKNIKDLIVSATQEKQPAKKTSKN